MDQPDDVEKRRQESSDVERRRQESIDVEQRLQELIARQPSRLLITQQVEVVFQDPSVRIEENRVKSAVTGDEGVELRISATDHVAYSATVIPLLSNDRMVLVARYRYATGKWSLEFPRGKGTTDDETWGETAERVLRQVGGYSAKATRLLGAVKPDACLLSHSEIVVLAKDCEPLPHHRVDTTSPVAGSLVVSLADLERLITNGHIECGVSLAALTMYRVQLGN